MPTNVKKAFATWLEQTFLKWQADNGKRASLLEFADHIGYSRPLISMWLAAKRLPGEDGVTRLAELFGDEIYDVLDLPRPNPYLQKINQIFEKLSPEQQQKLAEMAERYEVKSNEANSQRASMQRKTSTN